MLGRGRGADSALPHHSRTHARTVSTLLQANEKDSKKDAKKGKPGAKKPLATKKK